MWRISKDLLHSDDRPPDTSPQESKLLCGGFAVFTMDKLKSIAANMSTRLKSMAACLSLTTYTRRNLPFQMDTLVKVTVGEMSRLIGMLAPKTSALDFMPIALLKSSVDVMAPLITRLANMSFSSGVFPSTLKTWPCHSTSEEAWNGQVGISQLCTNHQFKHTVEAAGKASPELYTTSRADVR